MTLLILKHRNPAVN